jgi:hypothetical protein
MRAQPKGRSFQLLFSEFKPAHQHQNAGENQLPTALDPRVCCVSRWNSGTELLGETMGTAHKELIHISLILSSNSIERDIHHSPLASNRVLKHSINRLSISASIPASINCRSSKSLSSHVIQNKNKNWPYTMVRSMQLQCLM